MEKIFRVLFLHEDRSHCNCYPHNNEGLIALRESYEVLKVEVKALIVDVAVIRPSFSGNGQCYAHEVYIDPATYTITN